MDRSHLWIMVSDLEKPLEHRDYTVLDGDPDSFGKALPSKGFPQDHPCKSFADLCAYIRESGYAVPPVEYFNLNQDEREEKPEIIFRRIPSTA